MTELWKPIAEAPGYEVSDLGRVRCWNPRNHVAHAPAEPRLLKPDIHLGYLRVKLGKHGPRRWVHRLVLEAFVGPRPPGAVARHVQTNDPTDNRPCNLAWGTHKENTADRVRHGTSARGRSISFRHPRKLATGEAHGLYTHPEVRARKLAPADAADLRRRYQAGERCGVLAAEFGVSRRTVWVIGTERGRQQLSAELAATGGAF